MWGGKTHIRKKKGEKIMEIKLKNRVKIRGNLKTNETKSAWLLHVRGIVVGSGDEGSCRKKKKKEKRKPSKAIRYMDRKEWFHTHSNGVLFPQLGGIGQPGGLNSEKRKGKGFPYQ